MKVTQLELILQSAAKLFDHLMIRVKKLIPNAVIEINVCQVMIFRLYTDYNKQELIRIGN